MGRHLGRFGLWSSFRPASWGVRLPLRLLQGTQEQTMFSHDVSPPRSRGMTWSRLRSLRSYLWPQYWQVLWSRSKMLCRVNLTSFFGMRSKKRSRITLGTRILNETVLTTSAPSYPREKLYHWSNVIVWNEPLSASTTCAWPW